MNPEIKTKISSVQTSGFPSQHLSGFERIVVLMAFAKACGLAQLSKPEMSFVLEVRFGVKVPAQTLYYPVLLMTGTLLEQRNVKLPVRYSLTREGRELAASVLRRDSHAGTQTDRLT